MDIRKFLTGKVGEKQFDPSEKVKPKSKDKRDMYYWRDKFETAAANYDVEVFDTFEALYRGTHETTREVNSQEQGATAKSNLVRNISYELVESQINTDVPMPVVKPRKPGFENQAKMVQEKIISDFNVLKIDKIIDKSERDTYAHGFSILLLTWDIESGTHEFMGEKDFVLKHPKQFIPQVGIYDVQDMDYFFLLSNMTRETVKRVYGVDVDSLSSEYKKYNELGDMATTSIDTALETEKDADDSESIAVVTCYYKDDDGDVCKFVWAGDEVIEDYPKYYYPRVEACQACGYENPAGTEECLECGSPDLKEEIITEEVFYEDVELEPIAYKKPVKRIDGDMVISDFEDKVAVRLVPEGTRIPLPVSKKYPLIIRYNIPLNFSIRGRSDIETIRDQQESIKKVYARMERKVLMAPVIIGMHRDLQKEPDNEIYEVYKGTPDELSSIFKYDLSASIREDLEFSEKLYQDAKSVLGITDSFQGKYDPSAKSGVAKEKQITQAAGRLQSKIKNKFTFFEDLFEMMFLFDLMFTKEERYYYTQDRDGKDEYRFFNKHDLLVQDNAGEWYYNTDFFFGSEVGEQESTEKKETFEILLTLANSKLIEPVQMWQILAFIGFPVANKILEQLQNNEDPSQYMAMVLEVLSNMSPEERDAFLQQPIEEQLMLLQEALQNTNENV